MAWNYKVTGQKISRRLTRHRKIYFEADTGVTLPNTLREEEEEEEENELK
jgi:hypothetical protein